MGISTYAFYTTGAVDDDKDLVQTSAEYVTMATTFASLPIIDLSALSDPSPTPAALQALSKELSTVFATTGFAYLTHAPLSFSHEDVFALSADFFRMSDAEKAKLAKKTFVPGNRNTYRGYFPPQPAQQRDNLKEGFEVGPPRAPASSSGVAARKFNLAEPNVWPTETAFATGRARLEQLYAELQALSSSLLSLLAVALGKPADFFAGYLGDSLSTLRLLHYPPQASPQREDDVGLCCTPHTDSGILTLLHQDPTGGLEVLNAEGDWVAAPYVPGSIVVNIGDLLASVSGGRFVATMHRVRTNSGGAARDDGMGRFSVPFFFEPGEQCVVKSVDGGDGVVYGDYVRQKMSTWVEYQDSPEEEGRIETDRSVAVAA